MFPYVLRIDPGDPDHIMVLESRTPNSWGGSSEVGSVGSDP